MLCLFLRIFFYTLMLLLVKSFSYKPHAMFIPDEFLLDIMGHLFEWGVSLTSLSYTLRSGFCEEFLLHSSSWFLWGVSPTLLELVWMRSFSYTRRDGFSEEFLLQTPDAIFIREEFLLYTSGQLFYWGVCLALLELVLLRSFSYTPRAGFSEEFLLHS